MLTCKRCGIEMHYTRNNHAVCVACGERTGAGKLFALILGGIWLLAAIFYVNNANASENECNLFKLLDESQEYVVNYSYQAGNEVGLGYTLAAIALAESSAGRDRVNWKDPSFGAYHILISSASNRLHVTDKDAQIKLAYNIATDDVLGAQLAISELLYWQNRHKHNWRKMVQSYNAGNKYWKGKKYLTKIQYYVRQLKQCKMGERFE